MFSLDDPWSRVDDLYLNSIGIYCIERQNRMYIYIFMVGYGWLGDSFAI